MQTSWANYQALQNLGLTNGLNQKKKNGGVGHSHGWACSLESMLLGTWALLILRPWKKTYWASNFTPLNYQ